MSLRDNINQTAKLFIYNCQKITFPEIFCALFEGRPREYILHSIFSVQLVPSIAYILSYFFLDGREMRYVLRELLTKNQE